MYFRAVGRRVAVDLADLKLPISSAEALEILQSLGVRVVHVDIVAIARDRIGKARYRRGARMSEAPRVVDCSSLTKWLYGKLGICLPRYSIDQCDFGTTVIPTAAQSGDLIFTAGYHSWYHHDPKRGIGHVGIVTGERTVIHAADSKRGVIEEPLETWLGWSSFRGICRIIPSGSEVLTLDCPLNLEVETSSDLRWKILQHLSR